MTEKDTKERIAEAANQLFSKKGYEGTSIRDIAGAAAVNVAAINYHYKNKENLYWQITFASHLWFEDLIEKVYQNSKGVEDLTIKVFEKIHEDSGKLKNCFRIFLSDSTPEVDEKLRQELLKQKEIGPPGGQYFLDAITSEVGENVELEKRKWAMKAIFGGMVHWALIQSTNHCKTIYKDHPDFKYESVIGSLRDLTRACLKYIS
jgi:AcrR family transcriptional regulator